MGTSVRQSQQGQALTLFALALTAIVLGAAVVVDGGYAFAQRRQAQNAVDFAAMAGTRIVGQALTGNPPGSGTAANVENAILAALTANDATLVSAKYVDETGSTLGDIVGAASIPRTAFGVVVEARADWEPFFLGVIGITDWVASASATAITPGASIGGGVMPVGIEQNTYDGLTACPITDLDSCIDQKLTSGVLNIPGGFGWLKFGIQGQGGKCDWASSLGMKPTGCDSSKTFLDSQIGPPANSHGCCTAVGLPGSEDKIGSLTGNEWGDLSFYIENRIPIWVPVYSDPPGKGGANGYYDIVGFGAMVFTGDNKHAKWLEGAAVSDSCKPGTQVAGRGFCTEPGGAFIIDVTGEVQLRR
jgi:hypothetical protein